MSPEARLHIVEESDEALSADTNLCVVSSERPSAVAVVPCGHYRATTVHFAVEIKRAC
jgi:hypothetical protein